MLQKDFFITIKSALKLFTNNRVFKNKGGISTSPVTFSSNIGAHLAWFGVVGFILFLLFGIVQRCKSQFFDLETLLITPFNV